MDHDEIQTLLGAYVLDAVEPDEAAEIETHLRDCPRCQAEVAAYREVAALLANNSAKAPEGGWDQIASRLGASESLPSWPEVARLLPSGPASKRRRQGLVASAGAIFAAAAVAIALLAVHVANLDQQVGGYQALQHQVGLSQVVAKVLSSTHREVMLTSASRTVSARIAIGAGDEAYWVSSSLPALSSGHTYQLWALADGKVVSLGLIGADPNRAGAFLIDPAITMLMVTAEPAGGTPGPTTPVLLSSPV